MALTGGDSPLLTAADDGFHPPDASRWFHETWWFWFFVPERAIGGWLYSYVRPNIGVCGGGCWVWDEHSFLHWEAPYYAHHSHLPLPRTDDPASITFPTGMWVHTIEPLQRYGLLYADAELISLDLEFDAVMEPWVRLAPDEDPPRPVHLDQVGRVSGSLTLLGESHHVSCLAIRDRTWAPRSERWRHGGGYGYTNAAASSDLAFLAVGDDERVGGYLVDRGERQALVSGRRRVARDPNHGFVTRVQVEATDAAGRRLEAYGVSVSRMAMPIPGVHGVVWASLVDWTINGVQAWGEDQEPWPITVWSEQRRAGRL